MGRIACRCCRDGLGADIRHAAIGRGWRAGLAGLCLGPGAKPQEQAARDAAHWFSMARPGLSSWRAVTVAGLGLWHGSAGPGSTARVDHGLPGIADAGHGDASVLWTQWPCAGGRPHGMDAV